MNENYQMKNDENVMFMLVTLYSIAKGYCDLLQKCIINLYLLRKMLHAQSTYVRVLQHEIWSLIPKTLFHQKHGIANNHKSSKPIARKLSVRIYRTLLSQKKRIKFL
ncbi:hypothetical protein KFK09_025487 [Dendrobium nobile]|uniref:Uncharacterized protein n=1 Tax=Dendrobium nobile TaxID=94219 RepID=A0A8T3AGA9_DENNO|nr:hypothetical protein KFK09_025487 [Dendrobium nobile]